MTQVFYNPFIKPGNPLKKQLLWLFLLPLLVQAQTVLQNNGSSIYIQRNALVHVQGGFVNANTDSAAAIYNDGVLEVKGDFENKPGAGFRVHSNSVSKDRAVKLVGSGKQLIKGNMSTPGQSSFYNLIIDKASSSDTVEMQTQTMIEGSLVFGTASITTTYEPTATWTNNNQKGLVKTFNDSLGEFLLQVENGNPDAIAGYPVLDIGGAPNTGFILTSGLRGTDSGGLERKITSATSYTFPVGTPDKGFNAVRLNFSQVPGDGTIKMKFCSGSSNPTGQIGKISPYCIGCTADNPAMNNGYNRYIPSNPCNGGAPQWVIFENTVSNHGYWSFESSNEGYSYDMEVYPNGMGTLDMSKTWRVIKHEDAYGVDPSRETVDWTAEIDTLIADPSDLVTYTRNGGCYTGSGIPGGHYKNFSHFGIGGGGGGGALPVEMMYIKAENMGKHRVRVSWATALEINNKGFHVLRSTDAVNFTEVGWVDGNNNSTTMLTYEFEDRVPVSTTYYYKLKQVDYDGAFAFSNLAEVKLADMGDEFKLYPNPTANDLFLEISNPVDEVRVNLYDATGQVVYDNIFVVQENGTAQTFTINASQMITLGTYVLTARTNGNQYSAKVILQ